ncbi:hypothetical protein Poli38472_000342 [Pythium oligandrum]|uniref:GDT1 family protein n=1 Tax=Pythium oligandrum TaxID=41045 RepID=A0A8K1FE98_PYTOL|nr:hypothetical protein Poli38472_000342 [Pythium oligandrum]|eukprot:TMW60300.1 hypothetical protein Poli38472_000342 [Pythium oligandrum]
MAIIPLRSLTLCALLALASTLVVAQEAPLVQGNEPEPAAPAVKNAAFDRADLDHNGVLDQGEFATYTANIQKVLRPFLGYDSVDDNALAHDGGGARGDPAVFNNNAPVGGANRPRFRGTGVNKFWSGFMSGILTIWATEIGDKTFFIAAILSMKKDRIVVFAGAIGALIVMTVLSVVMGVVATKFLPPSLTHYLGAVLFVLFGARMIYDAREMSATGPSEELAEVEDELLGKKNEGEAEQLEDGNAKPASAEESMMKVFSQAFFMTFLAEWGDRSQIATVTLSATKDAFGVTLGAVLGHSMCTGIAVVGGKFLASRISERTVALVGGVLFLLFALHSFVMGPSEA